MNNNVIRNVVNRCQTAIYFVTAVMKQKTETGKKMAAQKYSPSLFGKKTLALAATFP